MSVLTKFTIDRLEKLSENMDNHIARIINSFAEQNSDSISTLYDLLFDTNTGTLKENVFSEAQFSKYLKYKATTERTFQFVQHGHVSCNASELIDVTINLDLTVYTRSNYRFNKLRVYAFGSGIIYDTNNNNTHVAGFAYIDIDIPIPELSNYENFIENFTVEELLDKANNDVDVFKQIYAPTIIVTFSVAPEHDAIYADLYYIAGLIYDASS